MIVHTVVLRTFCIAIFVVVAVSAVAITPAVCIPRTGASLFTQNPDPLIIAEQINQLNANRGWRKTWTHGYGWTNGTSWTDNDRTHYTYTQDQYLSETTMESYQTGSWLNNARQQYTYDPGYLINTLLSQNWTNNTWTNSYRMQYTYNAENQISQVLSTYWTNGAWDNSSFIVYTYNAAGQIDYTISQGWVNGIWTNSAKNTYTFDANDRMTSIIGYNWSDNAWWPLSRSNYTYTGFGEISLIDIQNWDAISQTYQDYYRMQYTYNAQEQLTQILGQMEDNEIWNNLSASNYTYDTNSNQIEAISQYYSSGWVNSSRILTDYEQYTSANHEDNMPAASLTISAFPNPFISSTTVSIKSSTSCHTKLKVYNLKGQLITTKELALTAGCVSTVTFADITKPGVYLLKVTTPQVKYNTLRLIKY